MKWSLMRHYIRVFILCQSTLPDLKGFSFQYQYQQHARIQKVLSEGVQLWQRFILVDEGKEEISTSISGLSLNFVTFSGDPDLYC